MDALLAAQPEEIEQAEGIGPILAEQITEELSENGGPFVRLGSAIYTRVGASK